MLHPSQTGAECVTPLSDSEAECVTPLSPSGSERGYTHSAPQTEGLNVLQPTLRQGCNTFSPTV